MRGGFGFRVAVVCVVMAAEAASAQARARQSKARRANGEIAVDVTVRTRPVLTAPGITDLPAGTAVRRTRSRTRGWARITQPTRGWIPVETFASQQQHQPPSDDALTGDRDQDPPGLGPPAATSAAPRAARSIRPAQDDRSESDLMLEALRATQGESPNAARIARVVRDTALEVKRKRASAPVPTFWSDPFVDDSEPPVLVLPRRFRGVGGRRAWYTEAASEGTVTRADLMAARRDAARARAEAAGARAEAAAMRAEAARANAEVARREAAAAHADALAAKHDAEVARAGCTDDAPPRRALLGRGPARRDLVALREAVRAERPRKVARGPRVLNGTHPRRAVVGGAKPESSRAAAAVAPPADDPAPLVPAVAPQPASASYRGILVVPIK